MWPDQAEWVECQEYWFLDASNCCNSFCIFLFVLVLFCCCCFFNNFHNEKSYWQWVFHFWKLYVSSLQPYLHLIFNQGRHVTHSALSGHIFWKKIQATICDTHSWNKRQNAVVKHNTKKSHMYSTDLTQWLISAYLLTCCYRLTSH